MKNASIVYFLKSSMFYDCNIFENIERKKLYLNIQKKTGIMLLIWWLE